MIVSKISELLIQSSQTVDFYQDCDCNDTAMRVEAQDNYSAIKLTVNGENCNLDKDCI